MNSPLVFRNGQLIVQAEASLALNDAGFVFGATITDYSRTFHGRLFRLGEHVERFRNSCRAAAIDVPYSDQQLTDAAEQLACVNAQFLRPEQELALILLATPGPIGYLLGQQGGPGETPTVMLHTFALPFERYRSWFRDGVRLVVPKVCQVSPSTIEPHLKHRSRLHWWLAEREVKAQDAAAHALLADESGQVTETAAANFLIVRGGTVLSPPRNTILDGISLRLTRELCGKLGIPFAERALRLADCVAAQEAMLTGTAFCLAGVRSVNGTALPWPGPVTERLTAAWSQLVGLDYLMQMLAGQ